LAPDWHPAGWRPVSRLAQACQHGVDGLGGVTKDCRSMEIEGGSPCAQRLLGLAYRKASLLLVSV